MSIIHRIRAAMAAFNSTTQSEISEEGSSSRRSSSSSNVSRAGTERDRPWVSTPTRYRKTCCQCSRMVEADEGRYRSYDGAAGEMAKVYCPSCYSVEIQLEGIRNATEETAYEADAAALEERILGR